MKKSLLLLPFLLAGIAASAGCTCARQNSWRWRYQNGSETSATWMALQSTPATYAAANGIIRLRIELLNTSYHPGAVDTDPDVPISVNPKDTLQYSLSPLYTGPWITVDDNPSKAFVLAGPVSFITQNEPTTSQLTGRSDPFDAGSVVVSSSIYTGYMRALGRTEVEWAIKGTANMLPNTVYYFRQYGTTRGYAYNATWPSVTTVSNVPLPVKLTRFSVGKEGGRVRIEWSTATEEASDRFEILRSADGRNWQTLTQVQSVGNATSPTNYSAHDDRPLSGLNSYRLKQVDKDGKSAFSDVKSVRLFTDVTVSVWPNPASAYLNFSLQQAEAQVMVTLQDATGRTVQQERFSHLQAGAVSKWALPQKMPAGIYVLKLETEGFSETRKIIIR